MSLPGEATNGNGKPGNIEYGSILRLGCIRIARVNNVELFGFKIPLTSYRGNSFPSPIALMTNRSARDTLFCKIGFRIDGACGSTCIKIIFNVKNSWNIQYVCDLVYVYWIDGSYVRYGVISFSPLFELQPQFRENFAHPGRRRYNLIEQGLRAEIRKLSTRVCCAVDKISLSYDNRITWLVNLGQAII